jgi:hypothetical protein
MIESTSPEAYILNYLQDIKTGLIGVTFLMEKI